MQSQEIMKFKVQVVFSSIVLLFCVGKLAIHEDSNNAALYWGGLTSVLAWWMPSPTGEKEDNLFLGGNGSSPKKAEPPAIVSNGANRN